MYLPRRPTPVMREFCKLMVECGARDAGRDAFKIEFGGENASSSDELETKRGRRVLLREAQALR